MSFDWYLIRVGSTYKIVDLSVLGISQARAYRDQFTSVMRRSGRGLEGLVSAIEAKAKELENAAVD